MVTKAQHSYRSDSNLHGTKTFLSVVAATIGRSKMPTYTFLNKETGEEFDELIKLADYDQFLIDNPHLSRVITAPNISGDSVGLGFRRNDDGFNDLMHRIGKANRGSHVAEKYVSKSATEVKVSQTVDKHKKRGT